MPHLTVATAIEKERIESDTAFVPLLDIDVIDPDTGDLVETLYFCRNDEDIVYRGHTYMKAAFDLKLTKSSGEMSQMSVTVKDFTRAVQERMQTYQGGVGFTVRLTVVNTGNLSAPPEIQETASVTAASTNNYDIEFTLGAENPLLRRFPAREQAKDRCLWQYRDKRCAYTGELPTCDFTLQGSNGCAAHDNSERFGGFPGITTN